MFRKDSQSGARAGRQNCLSSPSVTCGTLLSVHFLKTITVFSAKNNSCYKERGDWTISEEFIEKSKNSVI